MVTPIPRARSDRTIAATFQPVSGQLVSVFPGNGIQRPQRQTGQIARWPFSSLYRDSNADKKSAMTCAAPCATSVSRWAWSARPGSRRASRSWSRTFPIWLRWSSRCSLSGRCCASRLQFCTADCWRSPGTIDKHVGSRVRQQREALGISQAALGMAIGVTFQQVQKYENGVNRIAAGRRTRRGSLWGNPHEERGAPYEEAKKDNQISDTLDHVVFGEPGAMRDN